MTKQEIKLMNREIDKFMSVAKGLAKVEQELHDSAEEMKPRPVKISLEKESRFRLIKAMEFCQETL
jgi:hypothetical protein